MNKKHKRHRKRRLNQKRIQNFKKFNKLLKIKTILGNILISFYKIINWFRCLWYPLNHAEIEMINQLFEGYTEVSINEKILIGDAYYIIDKNIKFRFNYTLFTENCWAYNIRIWYENKNEAIILCSSVQGPLMGHGHYIRFVKGNNKWVKKGTAHWIS